VWVPCLRDEWQWVRLSRTVLILTGRKGQPSWSAKMRWPRTGWLPRYQLWWPGRAPGSKLWVWRPFLPSKEWLPNSRTPRRTRSGVFHGSVGWTGVWILGSGGSMSAERILMGSSLCLVSTQPQPPYWRDYVGGPSAAWDKLFSLFWAPSRRRGNKGTNRGGGREWGGRIGHGEYHFLYSGKPAT